MTLPEDYLRYPHRRHGMDHDRYKWSLLQRREPVTWPGGARVALWVVPALEFFPLDQKAEPFKAPGGMVTPYPDLRHYTLRDYGNRIGIFRIMKVLDELDVRASVATNSAVAERYPFLVDEVTRRGWEIIAHGVDMGRLHYGGMDIEDERAQIREALETLRRVSGQPVKGWLSPAKSESANTLDLAAAEGIEYVCDWVNDDQPYMIDAGSRQMVSLPYSMEINDRPAFDRYYRSSDEFELMIRRQFDVLYREGAESGRVMSISVHPFIIGVPHRIWALESGLDYIASHDDVWFATGEEIVDHYLASGVTV